MIFRWASPTFAAIINQTNFCMKQKLLFLIPLFAILATTVSFAQNETHRSTISATAGLNLFQFLNLVDGALSDSLGTEVKIKATGSYGLTYDYSLTNWFSIGGAVGFNTMSLDAPNVEVERDNGTFYNGPIEMRATRTNIAIRPLFHYGNKGRIDMYSGFRIGASIWSGKVEANGDLAAEDLDLPGFRGTGAALGFQFIPFGLRGYVTENIGLGFELAVGPIHYAALQVNYRM